MKYVPDLKKVYTKEVANSIIDLFEDLLDDYDISIPDEDRTGDDGEARLYGMTYDKLLTQVEYVIIELMERCDIDFRPAKWNEGFWID